MHVDKLASAAGQMASTVALAVISRIKKLGSLNAPVQSGQSQTQSILVQLLALEFCNKQDDCVCCLQDIMKAIFKACKEAADEYNTNLQGGANIAGCLKVADAMIAQGLY